MTSYVAPAILETEPEESQASPTSAVGGLFDQRYDETAIQVEKIRARAQFEFRDLEQLLNLAWEKSNIDRQTAFELVLSDTGDIQVSGDHHQKTKIEKLVNGVFDIAEQFRRVGALLGFLRRADEALIFQQACITDHRSAVNDYGYLLDDTRIISFGLTVADDCLDIFFSEGKKKRSFVL